MRAALPSASMIEFIGVDPQTLGIAGLITLVVLMILAGFLIPSRTHDKLIKSKNEEIQRWRIAYETSEAARLLEAETLEEIVEQGRTTQHVIEAVHNLIGTHTPQPVPPTPLTGGGPS